MISHTSHPIVDIDGISKLNMLIIKSVYPIEFGFALIMDMTQVQKDHISCH